MFKKGGGHGGKRTRRSGGGRSRNQAKRRHLNDSKKCPPNQFKGGPAGGRGYDSEEMSPIILYVAGASGRMAGEHPAGHITRPLTAPRATLSAYGTVVGPVLSLEGKNLTGGSGAGISRVIAIHKAIKDAKRDYPGRKIFIATQSAGGRFVTHAFAGKWQTKPKKDGTCTRFQLGEIPDTGDATAGTIKKTKQICDKYPDICTPRGRIPEGVAGLIIFGYPLKHATQDRSLIFPEIKPSAPPFLFLSGSKDPMGIGMDTALKRCKAKAKLVIVPGGQHDCWHPYGEERHSIIHSAIGSFIESCLEQEEE